LRLGVSFFNKKKRLSLEAENRFDNLNYKTYSTVIGCSRSVRPRIAKFKRLFIFGTPPLCEANILRFPFFQESNHEFFL
jgi:hypothetical protein